jgi:L-aspartate oxidase
MMGGVWTDLDGATTLPGLFAAGEVACSGVHGANRLASNSLLEGLVFGMRAARAAIEQAEIPGSALRIPDLKELESARPAELEDPEKLRSSLRRLMWGKVGLVRSRDSLISASAQLSRWTRMLSKSFGARAGLEVKNMVQVGRCVAEAALWRENSVGAHYRSDMPPGKRPGWKQHSHLSIASPVVSGKPPKERGVVIEFRRRGVGPASGG